MIKLLKKKEAEDKEEEAKKKYENINEAVRTQVDQYKKEKSRLMRWALRELVRENIEYGQQMISLWKELGSVLDA